jgi:predicted house-cleaning noncanonical NTP pyrophosphatase (MazG superfamily)
MRVTHNKLVRDRIPEIIRANGDRPVTRVLGDADYRAALLAKLVEEAGEASQATASDLPGELADVLEVVKALTAEAGLTWEQMLALADGKRARRGGFRDRLYLEFTDSPA